MKENIPITPAVPKSLVVQQRILLILLIICWAATTIFAVTNPQKLLELFYVPFYASLLSYFYISNKSLVVQYEYLAQTRRDHIKAIEELLVYSEELIKISDETKNP